MMLSVQCHEEIAFSPLGAFQEEVVRHPDVAGIYAHSLLGEMAYAVCEGWGAGRAEASANEPAVSDVPTLVMAGEFDPITPPAWGRHAAATLANSFFYEFPGVGHGASALPGCPREMFVAFLEEPRVEPDDACIAGMQ